jgi:uncharacterized membrane protein
MPYPIIDMVLYFFIYSFCGWLMETILCSFNEKRFVNRGFLNGPICPIYGCALALILIFLIPVRERIENIFVSVIVIFLTSTLLATIVEYLVSWLMEKLFKARWWDYSHYKYNINGRVDLTISLIWGGLSTAVLYFIHPQFQKLVEILYSAGNRLPYIIVIALLCLLTIDLIISVFVALRIGEKLDQLEKLAELIHGYIESLSLPTKEDILKKIEDLYERVFNKKERKISDKAKEVKPDPELHKLAFEALKSRISGLAKDLGEKRESLMEGTRYLQRRMLRAFPHMKRKGNTSSLYDWKDRIRKRKK